VGVSEEKKLNTAEASWDKPSRIVCTVDTPVPGAAASLVRPGIDKSLCRLRILCREDERRNRFLVVSCPDSTATKDVC